VIGRRKRSGAVGAGFGVDAFLGEAEALDGTAGDEMFGDDLGGVFRLHAAVPDGLRVNNDRWSVLALVEAERLVDAHRGAEAGGLGLLLQGGEERADAIGGAGWPRSAGGAYVMTDKDVMFKRGQAIFLLVRE